MGGIYLTTVLFQEKENYTKIYPVFAPGKYF